MIGKGGYVTIEVPMQRTPQYVKGVFTTVKDAFENGKPLNVNGIWVSIQPDDAGGFNLYNFIPPVVMGDVISFVVSYINIGYNDEVTLYMENLYAVKGETPAP